MKNKKGFTLTEILLASVIVGMIGVALASLTTAATRKSGAGNSRVMLRNSLSVAMRQLRYDVHDASRVLWVQGPMASSSSSRTKLLVISRYDSVSEEKIAQYSEKSAEYIAYCFERGNTTNLSSGDNVQPSYLPSNENKKTRDGGIIYRVVWDKVTEKPADFCATPTAAQGSSSVWLRHVKFISNDYTYDTNKHYPVPLFTIGAFNTTPGGLSASTLYGNQTGRGAILLVKLIVELPSYPVVNETMEETFVFTNGGQA